MKKCFESEFTTTVSGVAYLQEFIVQPVGCPSGIRYIHHSLEVLTELHWLILLVGIDFVMM